MLHVLLLLEANVVVFCSVRNRGYHLWDADRFVCNILIFIVRKLEPEPKVFSLALENIRLGG